MSDRVLSGLILILAAFGWISAAVLVNAARKRPRIGVLTERAALGVLVAVFVTLYGLAAFNSDAGFPLIGPETVRTVIRLLVVGLGLVPVYWVALYLTGRLGSDE